MVNIKDIMAKYFSPRVLNQMKGANKQSCRCRLDHIHDSRLEAGHCDTLNLMARAVGSDIALIERQKQFDLIVNGKKICAHRVDFLITRKDGTQYVVESKGFSTDLWQTKMKLFKALFPNIEYQVWYKGGRK
jgi:hypothetical protein